MLTVCFSGVVSVGCGDTGGGTQQPAGGTATAVAGTGTGGALVSGGDGGNLAMGAMASGGASGGEAGQADSSGGSANGGSGGRASGGSGGGAQAGGAGGMAGGPPLATCDDVGAEPSIPEVFSTLKATKSVSNGVPSDETLDTAAIQAEIDKCAPGKAVKLTTDGVRTSFVSGPLFLKTGVTLVIDAGTTLFASHDPRDFDALPNACGTVAAAKSCYALINARNVSDAGVMGAGTVDGRGGEPLKGTNTSWWQVTDAAAGKAANPRLVQTSNAKNFTLYEVRFQNAPKFHVVIDSTTNYKVWGVSVITDPDSPNTDGIDPAGSTNGVIAYTKISTGDDNIAIKGSSPVVDGLVITHNHFGRGHGMSIGSETYGGVQNVLVCDLSLDGTDNGIRIKSDVSRGGLVQGIRYLDVCMRNVKKPLVFDPFYSTATGTQIPDFRDVTLRNVHVLGGGASTFRGYDAGHPLTITLDNVILDGASSATFTASNTEVAMGPNPVNFTLSGAGVKVTKNSSGNAVARDCSSAWVDF